MKINGAARTNVTTDNTIKEQKMGPAVLNKEQKDKLLSIAKEALGAAGKNENPVAESGGGVVTSPATGQGQIAGGGTFPIEKLPEMKQHLQDTFEQFGAAASAAKLGGE